jgi:CheY-like chemotaxis protein
MRFDDVVNLLGGHRDYLILGLAVLVLVEGAIIVLWARRAVRLRREIDRVAAMAEAARVAAERAAAAVEQQPAAYRVATPARREREVYSVAGRGEQSVPAAVPAPVPEVVSSAPPAPAAPMVEAVPAAPLVPAAAAETTETVPEPPAEYVSPVAEKAAAWVLPEVEASKPAAENGNGNGHAAGWFPAPTTPTTMGWSGTAVPVEPAADFAVVSADTPVGNGNGNGGSAPNLTVLDGTQTWSFPAAPVPTHFDPAMFDTNDDELDDQPISGDVLLVEDDATIAKLYRVLLESRGYTVRHAGDGLDGLDRANEKRPDLVLLDIMMPRMNGIAFLQALRSGEMRDVPVVVLSNFMEKQLVDDAMSLGALEYMVKAQTRPEALVGALPHWLRGERAFTY